MALKYQVYWFVDKDPYIGLLESLYIWVVNIFPHITQRTSEWNDAQMD